jgi:predicted acetylornithine/succinylornithine family transaminase
VWDADGKVYLDFLAGISVVNVGHCHPRVVEAIRRQAGELMHASNLYYTENQAKLARKLSELSLGGKVFFCNSGAEANEGLVKLARLWGHDGGRYEVLAMKGSFHGRTLAMAAATGQEKIQKGFEPMPDGFRHAELNDVASVEALVGGKTVAVLLEAIQGEGGVVPASDGFMQAVRRLCDEKNLLMLCDEVQCGMARTGNWFGYQASGVTPDGISLAKGLGSGYPIGAVVGGPKLADLFRPGMHASTFGGTPLACAAALATLEVIEEEGLVEKAGRAGELFKEGLAEYVEQFEHVKEVRGRGLMLGLVLDQPAKPLVDAMREAGLLALATAGNVVRFLPPLNVKDGELEEALDIIHDCLAEMHGIAVAEEDAAPAAEPAEAPAAAEPAAAQEEAGPAGDAPAGGAGAEAAQQ